MFKRMWKANRIFTFLFLITFSLTFCIVYYGMYLKSQIQRTAQTAEQMDYAYRGYYLVTWGKDVEDRLGVRLPELEQGILSYVVNVYGEDVVGVRSAYVVMEMKENLMEPLERGGYFQEKQEYDRPQCIVGDAWLQYAEKDRETMIVRVNGYDCEVAGVLKSNTFDGSDERMFLYGASMPGEFLKDLICMEESMSVDYRISGSADGRQIEKYGTWIQSGIFESPEEDVGMHAVDGGVTTEFTEVMPMYNIFFRLMVVFCFINCVFLTYVWCTKKMQENMIKRVCGFGMVQVWLEGFWEILLYEGISILISSIMCLFIEAVRGKAVNFFITWRYGIGIMVAVLLLFTFLLSMVNVFYLKKLKPADTLKATE